MNWAVFSLLLVSILNLSLCEAAKAITELEKLTFLGRVIQMKQTGEVIGLACEDSTCHSYRFAHLKSPNDITFIGDRILAPTASDPEVLKKSQELLIEQFFDLHPISITLSEAQVAKIEKFGFLSIVGIALAGSLWIKNTNDLIWTVSGTMGAYTVYAALSRAPRLKISNEVVTAKMTDQSGWKWSSEPNQVSKHKFHLLREQINFGSYMKPSDLSNQYSRRKAKLIKMGAHFERQSYE
jgi:hypothetical protein